MLTPQEIDNILKVIEKYNLIFISQKLGPDYLTSEEIKRLASYGIDATKMYNEAKDIAKLSFHFGLISDAIGEDAAKKATYQDLIEYFNSGKFIPLTKVEKFSIESIKKQFLGDIKALNGKIFNDVNNVIGQHEKNNRKAYEDYLRGEIERGVFERKTINEISRDISEKTGDWNRDFDRIVETTSHTAFEEGKAAMLEKRNEGSEEDILVYKDVYAGACKHCIKHYLTGGINSMPKIFKLSELRANGTNVGRKADEWKPVLGVMHPWCRCTLNEYDPRFEWDEETRSFSKPKETETNKKRNRKPIRIEFNGKQYEV